METSRKTLLLVEDEALIGMAESRTLHREGYSVIHVLSGEEALDAMNANGKAIDLILMDINLGDGIDGTDAAQEILKHHDIPIVFLSSHTDALTLQKTERIAAYGFVVKNLGSTMLFTTIKMAFKLHLAHKQIEMRGKRFKTLVEKVHEGICLTDEDERFVFGNSVAESIFGVEPGGLAGKQLSLFLTDEGMHDLSRCVRSIRPFDEEFEQGIIRGDGTRRKLKVRMIQEFDADGGLLGAIALFNDVTDTGEGESAGADSESGESILLRELQHRVKNSLNIIMSLLSLDAQRLTDEASKSVLVMAQARIRTVSLLYDYLSQSTGYDRINSVEYIRDLIRLLSETYTSDREEVRIREIVDYYELDSKFCLPLGLIINELLSNALKYAFPAGKGGSITVELRHAGGESLLRVNDDGVGLPGGYDWNSSSGFGLQLVKNLVGQLRGAMEIASDPGVCVTISVHHQREAVSKGRTSSMEVL